MSWRFHPTSRNWMAATLEPRSQRPPTSTCFSIPPQQITDLLKLSSSPCFVGLFHAQKRVAPVNEQSWGHSLKNPVQPRCHCLKNRTPTKKTRNRMSTAKITVKDLTQFQALGLSHTVMGLGFRVSDSEPGNQSPLFGANPKPNHKQSRFERVSQIPD